MGRHTPIPRERAVLQAREAAFRVANRLLRFPLIPEVTLELAQIQGRHISSNYLPGLFQGEVPPGNHRGRELMRRVFHPSVVTEGVIIDGKLLTAYEGDIERVPTISNPDATDIELQIRQQSTQQLVAILGLIAAELTKRTDIPH